MSYCLNFEDANYCFVTYSCSGDECSGVPSVTDADGTYILLANLPSD